MVQFWVQSSCYNGKMCMSSLCQCRSKPSLTALVSSKAVEGEEPEKEGSKSGAGLRGQEDWDLRAARVTAWVKQEGMAVFLARAAGTYGLGEVKLIMFSLGEEEASV